MVSYQSSFIIDSFWIKIKTNVKWISFSWISPVIKLIALTQLINLSNLITYQLKFNIFFSTLFRFSKFSLKTMNSIECYFKESFVFTTNQFWNFVFKPVLKTDSMTPFSDNLFLQFIGRTIKVFNNWVVLEFWC